MNQKCGDCGGELERGFLPDSSYAQTFPVSWHRGNPKKKKLPFPGGIQVDSSQTQPVVAFRCKRCGLLKFYAGRNI